MSEPLELAAVQRDDVLLDRLGRREYVGESGSLVTTLLAGWRTDISDGAESLPKEAAEDTRVVSSAGRRAARPVVAGFVAAAVLLSASGVAAAAARATPGSVLWPVTQVVAPSHAHSVVAREHVLRSLAVARKQASQGDKAAARATLADAVSRVDEVDAGDGKSTLQAKLKEFGKQLDGGGPIPAAPPPGPAPSASPVAPSPSAAAQPSPAPAPDPSQAPSPDPTPTSDPTPPGSPGDPPTPDAASS